MAQDYFFRDKKELIYDKNKVVLFNLAYSGGADKDKVTYLYNILENKESNTVSNNSKQLIDGMDTLVHISCKVIADMLLTRKMSDKSIQELRDMIIGFGNTEYVREFSN